MKTEFFFIYFMIKVTYIIKHKITKHSRTDVTVHKSFCFSMPQSFLLFHLFVVICFLYASFQFTELVCSVHTGTFFMLSFNHMHTQFLMHRRKFEICDKFFDDFSLKHKIFNAYCHTHASCL